MADPDEPTDEQAEARRQASAQDAAGDLARMGIDPAVLGLQAPRAEPAEPTTSGARVLPLRPGRADRPPEAIAGAGPVDTVPTAPPVTGPWPPVTGPTTQAQVASPVADRHMVAVDQLLRRAAETRSVPRQAGRWLSALTFGLVTPDAAETAHNEQFLLAAVRTRQSDRRVVTFCSGKGGVGTTSVAMGVALALAAVRDDAVVLADARSGSPSLAQMLGDTMAPSGRDLIQPGSGLGPVLLPGGLHVVDSCGWEVPLRHADAVALLDRLRRDHAFTLVDVGNDPGEAARAALLRSDQTVVVTSTGRWGVASSHLAMTRLRQLDPFAAARAVHVVVCTSDESYRRVQREVLTELDRGPARVVVVPSDPALRAGQPFDPASVRPATREAVLEVAAAIAVSGGVH